MHLKVQVRFFGRFKNQFIKTNGSFNKKAKPTLLNQVIFHVH